MTPAEAIAYLESIRRQRLAHNEARYAEAVRVLKEQLVAPQRRDGKSTGQGT